MPRTKARESQLWTWLKRAQPMFHKLHMERIENSAGKGTPDVHGCINGRSFTIELKTVARTTLINCGFRQEQIWWAVRRSYVGGKDHWLLIQVGSGAAARRYLIEGYLAGKLREPVSELYLSGLTATGITYAEDIFKAIERGT